MALTYQILNSYIDDGDKIVVGVSGGADSMCLLDLILKFSKEKEFDFYAVHVNHGIRDQEAERDQEFVKDFCKKNNVKLEIVKVDAKTFSKKQGKTLEQGARELRYNELFSFQKKVNANKLFVAHHMTDQAETVLMHIARGSSLSGAKGMANKGLVYRPLLSFLREEILKYNKVNRVEYVDDSTNDDINYTRNFVRKEILSRFEEIYPNFIKSLCGFAEKCRVDNEFIESMLPLDLIEKEGEIVKIDQKVKELNIAISLRLIKKAFENLDVFADIEQKHIIKVLELFDKKNGSKINLPCGLTAYKEYQNVVICKNEDSKTKVYKEFIIGKTELEGFGEIIVEFLKEDEKPSFKKGQNFVDFDKLPKNAVWRTVKEGDIFKNIGAGTKKLGDYFTDKKIAKRVRRSIPVLASGNKILVVSGRDTAESVKVDENSKKVVKITYKTNNINS